jgi:hypothetical protein
VVRPKKKAKRPSNPCNAMQDPRARTSITDQETARRRQQRQHTYSAPSHSNGQE